jgi:hypothetical protein
MSTARRVRTVMKRASLVLFAGTVEQFLLSVIAGCMDAGTAASLTLLAMTGVG